MVSATTYKKTKIIATIGPASEEKIEQLLSAGVNGVRLNFSHGIHSWHKDIIHKTRTAAKKLDRSVAIIQDLQGPKIRLGSLPSGGVDLKAGQQIDLFLGKKYQAGSMPVQFDFSKSVKVGHRVLLRDGTVQTIAKKIVGNKITVEIKNSGKVFSNQGINLPDTVFDSQDILTQKDLDDLKFGYVNDIDYVALSFVQSAQDILFLKKMLIKNNSKAKVIAKIETRQAANNLESIIEAADAVMIARGDLATETSNEDVPLIGREIIQLARKYKKPSIMATQMLESMISSPQPTRAEVNDIATAVSLGVSCVMLSGETAAGQYPVDTVKLMKRVILRSEEYFAKNRLEIDVLPTSNREPQELDVDYAEQLGPIKRFVTSSKKIFTNNKVGKTASVLAQNSVSLAAITLAEQVGAKLILAETITGSTALSISSLRPLMPIIIASPEEKRAIKWLLSGVVSHT